MPLSLGPGACPCLTFPPMNAASTSENTFIKGSTTMEYSGFSYTKKGGNTSKITGIRTDYYPCSTIKSTGCKGLLHVKETQIIEKNLTHTCLQSTVVASACIDYTDQMKDDIERLASSTADSFKRVWKTVQDTAAGANTGKPYRSLQKDQAKGVFDRTRASKYGRDLIVKVSTPPLGQVSEDDTRRFFQGANIGPKKRGQLFLEDMAVTVLFAHPDLVHLCKYPCHYYVDGTWKSSPQGFIQDFIVMIWDIAYASYIPIFHCLLQDKTDYSYVTALQMCNQATGYKMDPLSVTCDFERAVINEVKAYFRRTEVVGCLFHFKQALRRNPKNCGIPEDVAIDCMRIGSLDLLCYIPINEIATKGVYR